MVGCMLQVFYVESMSNPLIQVADLTKVAEFCQEAQADSCSGQHLCQPRAVHAR